MTEMVGFLSFRSLLMRQYSTINEQSQPSIGIGKDSRIRWGFCVSHDAWGWHSNMCSLRRVFFFFWVACAQKLWRLRWLQRSNSIHHWENGGYHAMEGWLASSSGRYGKWTGRTSWTWSELSTSHGLTTSRCHVAT